MNRDTEPPSQAAKPKTSAKPEAVICSKEDIKNVRPANERRGKSLPTNYGYASQQFDQVSFEVLRPRFLLIWQRCVEGRECVTD
jgi:hypothetical protein